MEQGALDGHAFHRLLTIVLTVLVASNMSQAVVVCVGADGHVAIEAAGHDYCAHAGGSESAYATCPLGHRHRTARQRDIAPSCATQPTAGRCHRCLRSSGVHLDRARRGTVPPRFGCSHGAVEGAAPATVVEGEVQAVSKFISTHIIWSDYLNDLPTRLPENACLSNIWAVSEMKETNKKKQGRKAKKSLTMRGVTKFADGVAAPEEIEAFLESLRNVDLLRRDFPQVKLAEIKWRREGNSEIAMFGCQQIDD